MSSSMSYCVKEKKPCIGWVEKYFKDCLCDFKDDVSFGLGLISLVCWGVAEIPQIITNFKTKSSHGVSLAFLLTWIAGDVFNLVGCVLEPATLPTQYYTALLYTISTIVLVLQSVYYDYIHRWWKCKQIKTTNFQENEEDQKRPLMNNGMRGNENGEAGITIPRATPKATSTSRKEFYYTSARSMAGSGTPPFRTYLRAAARSGPSTVTIQNDSSSDDDDDDDQPRPSARSNSTSLSQPRPIPKSVTFLIFLIGLFAASYATFLAASVNLPQENAIEEHSVYGQWLGWMMAAIYMGGRIPQIWLNIKRGSVEGLNPLMFIFALIANATYVGSILVRSTEWGKIKANMPWLLDAIVCIILQYMYYRYWRKTRSTCRDDDYYQESRKVTVS
ncbi:hypothetical protein G4B88_001945 [Cannabis sativa]|uniref:Uncharacterized protein n=1 Tax=Cannabis sativa TaxID=3483 RepID=A0A7J6HEB3_CANSA|nr:hypothetical protein G4B88_001945 [Cannabis sativa]